MQFSFNLNTRLVKEVELDFVYNEEDQAKLLNEKNTTYKYGVKVLQQTREVIKEENKKMMVDNVSSSSSDTENDDEMFSDYNKSKDVNLDRSNNNDRENTSQLNNIDVAQTDNNQNTAQDPVHQYCGPQEDQTGNTLNIETIQVKKGNHSKKRRVTVISKKTNNSHIMMEGTDIQNLKKKGKKKKNKEENNSGAITTFNKYQSSIPKQSNMDVDNQKKTKNNSFVDLTKNENSPLLSINNQQEFQKMDLSSKKEKKKYKNNNSSSSVKQHKSLTIKRKVSIFEKQKNEVSYYEKVMNDKFFRQVYADNICTALFTFPRFKRNYSKNYVKVQQSYTKFSKKKKTIVFDIDETLVYASHSSKEMPLNSCDTTIRIKVNKYGGRTKAYLSFRPYLIEMLMELEQEFELILYTCGTAEYAKAFSEAVHKLFLEKYAPIYSPNVAKDFLFFDHILSLSQCLYSPENDLFIKDLKILEMGRNLQDVIIVDNCVQSFFLQLTNGIPIYDYEGNKEDNALIYLTNYLKTFVNVDDVRVKINQDFQIMKILEEKGTLQQIQL